MSRRVLIIFLLVLLVLFIFAFIWVHHQIPSGDEPHYLIIAQSITSGHGLDLKYSYQNKDYQIWGYQTLDAHISPNSITPHEYSIHNIGWPLIFTPFFYLSGRSGIALLTSLLGALIFLNIGLLLKKIINKEDPALIISLIITFSIPIFIYSNQVFGEIFAAFLVLYSFRIIATKNDSFCNNILSILAISYLPWIHVKYLLISLVLLFWWICKNWRKRTIYLGLIYFISLFVMGYCFNSWFGSFSPNAEYPTDMFYDFQRIGQGVAVLLFDRTFGLFIYAPVYFLSLAGFYFLYKKSLMFFWKLITVFLSIFLVQSLNATMLGWAPVGRFLVVALPLISIPLALSYINLKFWSKILFWLLTSWGFMVSLILFRFPRLDYNISDPQFLNFISPTHFALGEIFPQFLQNVKFTSLNSSDILTLSFWLGVIILINLLIIFKAKVSKSTKHHPTSLI